MHRWIGIVAALGALAPAGASADTNDDGYCDLVEGAASATAATLAAPQIFGQFGYIEQPAFAEMPANSVSNLRWIGGVRYSLTNAFTASATKTRASADCRRHRAISNVRGALQARAVAARLQVLEGAQAEADRQLAQVNADVEAHRLSVPEATATRLRVEELRSLTSAGRLELAALPPPDSQPLGSLLTSYRAADADIESAEGHLRSLLAYDVSVRLGVDQFLQGSNTNPQFFGVVQLGFNIGALWLGNGNARAAKGRARYVRSGKDTEVGDAPIEELRATLDVEGKREQQLQTVVADLGRQMDALSKIEGDESKRFRDTLWFDWIKAKAELAYVQTHAAALREALGTESR